VSQPVQPARSARPARPARPALAERLARLLGSAVTGVVPAGGQHGVAHYRVELADQRTAFVKAVTGDRAGDSGRLAAALGAEARGLRWLAEADPAGTAGTAATAGAAGAAAAAGTAGTAASAGGVGVPEVLGCDDRALAIAWLAEETASRDGAERFGRELAGLHAAGAAGFGATWPAFIAGLPLGQQQADAWPDWYASHRLLPFARRARDAGTLTSTDVALIERVADRIGGLAGPAEPPARIHGDCWSGNVLWSGGRGWLIDPAAHGGHRETDLAMLALFGAPYLGRILAAYDEAVPLAPGWRDRVPLHQLHPLLVHVCLFGAAYTDSTMTAARRALAAG
jgi:fructosamine-3-kinase